MTGINYLDTRSDFWRQQKPIYARERDRKLMQERWLRDRKRRPSQTARYILKSLEDIDMCGWYSQKGWPMASWGQSHMAAGAPWLRLAGGWNLLGREVGGLECRLFCRPGGDCSPLHNTSFLSQC